MLCSTDRRRLVAALAATAAVALVPVASASAAGVNTQSFTTPGGAYAYTVPAGVHSVHVQAVGGAGGATTLGEAGGRGADVGADVPVTPGQVLSVYVAGNGSSGAWESVPEGGFNGGGRAGGWVSGSGGGASDVRTAPGDLGSRLVVAAGGGGYGASGSAGDADQPGTQAATCQGAPATAGSQTAGGDGGDCYTSGFASGSDGRFGAGGDAGGLPDANAFGGGGGGGWYGGGGGSAYGGGAGGSSHVAGLAANATFSVTGASPRVAISYAPGAATGLALALSASSITADGTATATATATVTDANGNPVPGDAITFSGDLGIQSGPVTDHGDGTYSATITASTTAGRATITAMDTSVSPSIAGTAPLVQTAGPAAISTVRLLPASIVADGSSTSVATATLTDGNGNPVAGDRVTFASSDPGQRIGPVTDDGDGTYRATITSSSAPGTATITATDTSVTPGVSGTALLTQTAPAVKQAADLKVAITAPASARRGATFQVKLTVTNAGPAAATSVITGLVVPPGLTVTSAGGGTQSGPAVSWTDRSIASGGSVTHIVTLKVAASARGKVVLPAATGSTQIKDPNYLNNAATALITLG